MKFELMYLGICNWAESHGITVQDRELESRKAGEFDGHSVTMNARYAADERGYYLVHALGSIVRWSLSRSRVQRMFDELRDAKKARSNDPDRLESAIANYRAFEIESSEFAVWLLE